MIFFFYGTETLQPQEKIQALMRKFFAKNPSGAGLVRIDCAQNDVSLTQVENAIMDASLFTQHRLIVIKNPFAFTATQQRVLADLLAHAPQEHVIVIWHVGSVRTTAVLYKALVTYAQQVKVFTPPEGRAYLTWLARRLNQISQGTTLARDAAILIADSTEGDLLRAHHVLCQCAAYADGGRVTYDVAKHFIAPQAQSQAFRAVEALTSGDRAGALKLLQEQIAVGEDAFKLAGLYAYHIRTLLSVADCYARGIHDASRIARETALKPFVVTKSLAIVRVVSLQQLQRMHAQLVMYDRAVKGGALLMADALQDFVVRVSVSHT